MKCCKNVGANMEGHLFSSLVAPEESRTILEADFIALFFILAPGAFLDTYLEAMALVSSRIV